MWIASAALHAAFVLLLALVWGILVCVDARAERRAEAERWRREQHR
jgi:hypothetical protein